MQLDPPLLSTDDDPGARTDTLQACINGHGRYEPGVFVLRLSPRMHEALNSIDFRSAQITFHELPDPQKQALSTQFHETIHWWQHVGSTFGFIYSLSYPRAGTRKLFAGDGIGSKYGRWDR